MDLFPVHPPLSMLGSMSLLTPALLLAGGEGRKKLHSQQPCPYLPSVSTHSLHLHPLRSLCHCSSSSLSSPPFILGPNHRSLTDSEVNSWVFLVAGHFAGRDRSPLNWAFLEPDDWGLCFLGFVLGFKRSFSCSLRTRLGRAVTSHLPDTSRRMQEPRKVQWFAQVHTRSRRRRPLTSV